MADRLGLEFPARRRADLERALADVAGAGTPHALLATLWSQPTSAPEWRALIRALTVRESYFFRDAPLFAALDELILAPLIAERRAAGELRLGLWSAGCARGEEAYSLAIELDRLLPDRADWALTILATDLDATALEAAKDGVYSEWSLRETPSWVRARHFRRRGTKRFELTREVREMVSFAPLNLAADAYPGSLDVIVCRNVLMYFTDAARRGTLGRLARALAPGGWLALSPLDAGAEPEALLEPVDRPGIRLHRRCEPVAAAAPASARLDPPPPEPRRVGALPRARAAADRGALDVAFALCGEALRADPLDAEAHLLLGAIEEERGDLEAAVAALRRAIYIAPNSPTAHFRLGALLLRTGDDGPGRRSLEAAAGLLGAAAPDAVVPGGDGVTAGRLLAAARAQLEPAP